MQRHSEAISEAGYALEHRNWFALRKLSKEHGEVLFWLKSRIPQLENQGPIAQSILRSIRREEKRNIPQKYQDAPRTLSDIRRLLERKCKTTDDEKRRLLYEAVTMPTLDRFTYLVKELGSGFLIKQDKPEKGIFDELRKRLHKHSGAIADIVILEPRLISHFTNEEIDQLVPHLKFEEQRVVDNNFEDHLRENSFSALVLGIVMQQTALIYS